jgi:predicted TPR repeat methyltransferase
MADTLIYFGSLNTLFSAISHALNMGGLFVFSIEDGSGYAQNMGSKLNCNGRYSHKKSYVLDVLKDNGFSLLSITPHMLRMELGNPVDGMLVMAIKGSKFHRSRLSLRRKPHSHPPFTHES